MLFFSEICFSIFVARTLRKDFFWNFLGIISEENLNAFAQKRGEMLTAVHFSEIFLHPFDVDECFRELGGRHLREACCVKIE